MIDMFFEIFSFIFYIPWTENVIFPLAIYLVFFISLYYNWNINTKNLIEYKNNINTYIYDDWKEPIHLQSIPGILMSIGIIGTFYLIYDSLNSLNGEIKPEYMITIITSHIAPAFSISALRILASIFYILTEKYFLTKIYIKKINSFQDNNNPITYVNIATKQLQLSQKLLSSSEEQTQTFKSLNNFSESLNKASEGMEMFGEIAITLEETLKPEKLGEVISNALMKEMKPVLNNIQEITANVDNNSQKITFFLENDLKNDVILPLLESVKSTDNSTKEMKQVLEKTSSVMEQTNSGFDKILENLNKLQTSQDTFVNNLDNVLDKQKVEFENTTNIITNTYKELSSTVDKQTNKFEENSKVILDSFIGLSSEMKNFLNEYKNDYKLLLDNQQKAIEDTSIKAVDILEKAGTVASQTITEASDKLQGTLNGVDDALIKTSKSIKEELEKFKDSYTDSLKGFLDSQEEILNKVFKEQTEKLAGVVISFEETLENDVNNRKILNSDLEQLIKTTNGFVSGTQSMITTSFEEQEKQLLIFMENNKSMQLRLNKMIENADKISENGNILTKDLIDTTIDLSKQFNDNQTKVLKEYQIKVDEHLKDILNYMAAIIEASHLKNK